MSGSKLSGRRNWRTFGKNKAKNKQPDLEIVVENTGPEAREKMADVLASAYEAGVTSIVKSYGPNGSVTETTFEPGMPFELHSSDIEITKTRPYDPANNVAKTLLSAARHKCSAPLSEDDRPLIDILHEATFTKPVGLCTVNDEYALRMLLRKAHCFTLDEVTSAMVADFSMATCVDLEASRQMAIPPFPVTWIELNNYVRLKRMYQINMPLDKYDPASPPVKRIGWLIAPDPAMNGWTATYVTVVDIGVWVAPVSYWWHAGKPNGTKGSLNDTGKLMEWALFGTAGNVHPYDAFMYPSTIHVHYEKELSTETINMMKEMAGELRHIWGFLIALGAGQNGVKLTPQSNSLRAPPIMKNGKPLLPLEHKVLHLHLNKRAPTTLITQAITHHHNRRHDVRAHWRLLKSGRRVPVKSHQRGDELLGRIEKTYRVER